MPASDAADRGALIELATPGQPSDFRIGLQNFYVLTRYNRSAFYATAVADLASALKTARAQDPGR
jgi:membrane-bound lytic murein transglycosylase B